MYEVGGLEEALEEFKDKKYKHATTLQKDLVDINKKST